MSDEDAGHESAGDRIGHREQARRDRVARRHQLGHPPISHIEIGSTTHVVAQGVEPLDTDGVRTMTVGTLVWGLVAVGMVPFVGTLDDAGRAWWLWTAVAGFGLGMVGIEYCLLRRRALNASRRH